MNTYGNMLLIAMPIFLALILLELAYELFIKKEKHYLIDGISSLTSGMTNILKATLGLSIVVVSYPWFLSHLSLVTWPQKSFWPYIITFVFMDFSGYWIHRLQHRVNFFWTHHLVHHSSEEFNLPCALRQQISILTNIYSLSFLPLAILGIPHEVLIIVGPIHLFAQFWYHTRHIGRLGFLEHILVTPSHHRVHHAMNDLYMDKNYSQIFIIWDKLFGTFQKEVPHEPCVYGMRRPARTWNPFLINFKHFWLMLTDAWRTRSWKDKLRIWFMPTGWRPADVAQKHPVFTIRHMSELVKYRPAYSAAFQTFALLHLIVTFLLLSFLFWRFGEITQREALTYGIFLLVNIFGFTSLLDKTWYGLAVMLLSCAYAAGSCISAADWYGIGILIPRGHILVCAYYFIAGALSLWFYFTEFRAHTSIHPSTGAASQS
ncbi:MAG: sterol desaturase family protein [Chitinophagales bacterium]|nr:sterol desaturase family protein [Chitinophagales bacterium]MDW8418510.1 sterol desaturase family protein [Chitinophagales bacterium]